MSEEKPPAKAKWFKGPWVIHPLLVGAPAILDYTYTNKTVIDVSQTLFPIGFTALVAAVITLLLSLPLKSVARAGLITSLLVIGFHHHGHVASEWRIPMWVGIFAGCGFFAWFPWRLDMPTTFANIFAFIALCFPGYPLVKYQYFQVNQPTIRPDYLEALPVNPTKSVLPNIYFILLDGYAREDILLSRYGAINPLNDELRTMGFFVVDGAYSNYAQTSVSIASILNLDYASELIDMEDPDKAFYRLTFKRLIEGNRTTRALRGAGYRIATYPSEYSLAQLTDYDVAYAPLFYFTEYEYLLTNNTALLPATKLLGLPKSRVQHAIRRHHIQWVFDNLKAAEGQPTFTYVHLVAPHPPFVFEADGSYRATEQKFTFADGSSWLVTRGDSEEDYAEGYLSQLEYMNRQLIPVLSNIISDDPQAAIFLLSDHGPGKGLSWSSKKKTDLLERLSIQLAVRLPGEQYDDFDKSMTSINAFRVFLNQSVGTNLPPLPDRSYYMKWSRPCRFINVNKSLELAEEALLEAQKEESRGD
ncbi:MAG: sulfatase-like hydrolase/transferase [Proteobacteria bacterium]|nr:sulfatase-like hydrolase/transferase [Pseudomonadota bacterium]